MFKLQLQIGASHCCPVRGTRRLAAPQGGFFASGEIPIATMRAAKCRTPSIGEEDRTLSHDCSFH
jgi:hypothetical protein